MEILAPLATALLLGLLHTFEPDHLAAVSAFVVRRPASRAALGFGVRWAAGHGGVILLAGTVVVLLRAHVPEAAGAWLERGVGAILVLLGAWVMATARTLHAHGHAHASGTVHAHLHAHPVPEEHGEGARHEHGHAATAIGALHGLAGTAPAVALLPLARMESPGFAALYLSVFAVGTALAMGLYAMFAGAVAGRAARRSEALGRGLARLAGVGTVAVGLWCLAG